MYEGFINEVKPALERHSGKKPVIKPLNVTENGTYNSGDDTDGFNPVVVNVEQLILQTSPGGTFVKIGEMTVSYTTTKLDCTSYPNWQNITADNFILSPLNFQVFSTEGATVGEITCGTYKFSKSYDNGMFTASRASVSGKVGLKFDCEVYIYDPSYTPES